MVLKILNPSVMTFPSSSGSSLPSTQKSHPISIGRLCVKFGLLANYFLRRRIRARPPRPRRAVEDGSGTGASAVSVTSLIVKLSDTSS